MRCPNCSSCRVPAKSSGERERGFIVTRTRKCKYCACSFVTLEQFEKIHDNSGAPDKTKKRKPKCPECGQINCGLTGRHNVYFVRSVLGEMVKIGTAIDIEARFRALDKHSPVELELICTTPGGSVLEGELHDQFKKYHSHGEWFHLSEEIIKYIEEIKNICRAKKEQV